MKNLKIKIKDIKEQKTFVVEDLYWFKENKVHNQNGRYIIVDSYFSSPLKIKEN